VATDHGAKLNQASPLQLARGLPEAFGCARACGKHGLNLFKASDLLRDDKHFGDRLADRERAKQFPLKRRDFILRVHRR
jgi:hypothetical protein